MAVEKESVGYCGKRKKVEEEEKEKEDGRGVCEHHAQVNYVNACKHFSNSIILDVITHLSFLPVPLPFPFSCPSSPLLFPLHFRIFQKRKIGA